MAAKITETHDRITVNLGNGRRLGYSRYRDTCSGDVPMDVFRKWSAARTNIPKGKTLGDAVRDFVANLDTIWPEWQAAPPRLEVGDRVTARGPRGTAIIGTIVGRSKTGAYLNVKADGTGAVVGYPPCLLAKIE